MIVYGALLDNNNASDNDYAQGIAYDPVADRWRDLPPYSLSPQASSIVWTGKEMIAWDYGLRASAYDPAADRWRKLPDVPLDSSECYPASAYTSGVMFAQYCLEAGAILYTGSDAWKAIKWAGEVVAGHLVAADGVFLFAGATHEGTDNAL